jgi:hypothetical protein
MEISFLGNATIRGGINATDMGTLWNIMNHDGTAYSEGKGILTSKQLAKWQHIHFRQ